MDITQEKQLFEKCLENGITIDNIEEPFFQQKFKVIASSMDIGMKESPEAFFVRMNNKNNQAKQYFDDTQRRNEQIQRQKQEEELEAKRSKYSDLYGIDKPIKMVTDYYEEKIQEKIKEFNSAIQEVTKYESFEQTSLQFNSMMRGSERDWALAGGIASGIAGPAAGVASALDAQAHNASVRARNASLDSQTAQELVSIAPFKYKAKAKADRIKKEIQDLEISKNKKIDYYRTKVIGEQSDEEAFGYLKIVDTLYQINKSGSVSLTVRVSCKDGCNVFGNSNAHVDGTLMAQIFQKDNIIGVADLVSPLDGFTASTTILEGFSVCNAVPSNECSIIVLPKNIWTMEN